MYHIVIIEDEKSIADTLMYALQVEGYSSTWFQLARDALTRLEQASADLVILDVGLPDINGFEACRQLRRFSDVPVLFLTARGDEVDRIVGLEIGADDYVVKPFSPREVAARVRAILKRVSSATVARVEREPPAQPAEPFQIDEIRCTISFHGAALNLTRHEFLLLRHLLSQPGRVFSREQLLSATGVATDAGYERNVDSHIKALRNKLRQIAADAEPIVTHRGFGYSYNPEPR
jgi:two-component system catabolic regulation response regulator CreB